MAKLRRERRRRAEGSEEFHRLRNMYVWVGEGAAQGEVWVGEGEAQGEVWVGEGEAQGEGCALCMCMCVCVVCVCMCVCRVCVCVCVCVCRVCANLVGLEKVKGRCSRARSAHVSEPFLSCMHAHVSEPFLSYVLTCPSPFFPVCAGTRAPRWLR